MAKKQIPVTVQRVATGAVAFIELPLGPTYEGIHFLMTGTGLAVTMVDSIKLIANSQEAQTYLNLQQLIDLNAYHGRTADTAADWFMHFCNSDYSELAEELMEAIGTADLDSLTIEISLNGTWPANGTIVAEAHVDTEQQPLGLFNRIRQTVINSAVAGDIEYDKIIRGGAIYKQIHFFKADVNKVILEADGVKMYEVTKVQAERGQKNVRPFSRVPQTAKATHLDFVLSGYYGDVLRTEGMNDLRARLTLGSAGAVQIVTEQLDKLVN
jgi:hypothetical protein